MMFELKKTEKLKPRSRHALIICIAALIGAVLLGRLMILTLFEGGKWSAFAEDMSERLVFETGARGDITDRNGELLATSRPVYSACISRLDTDKEEAMSSSSSVLEILKKNGEDVSVTWEEVRRSLDDNSYMSYMPILLAEDIKAETAKAIQQADLPGVTISKNYVREYPQGALASHILGYLGRISEEEEAEYVDEKGYRSDAFIGKSGIEKVCEATLKGTDSVSRFQVDSKGEVTALIEKSEAAKGEDVQLCIDIRVQRAAEDALAQAIEQTSCGGTFAGKYGDVAMSYSKNAASGAAVAIDVNTGEVLAMASYPDFDPNDFAEGVSAEKWAEYQQENPNDPLSPSSMYNIAALSAVQPGSTFKPVTALAALECGLDEDVYLYDGGAVELGGRSFGCHLWNRSGASHGYVNLKEAMKVSCNYYFFDIATGFDLASGCALGYEKPIDEEAIVRFARELGLGEETGIEIPESAGSLPSEALKIRSAKATLKYILMEECETYFKKSILADEEVLMKKIEKIVNQVDKDLTLQAMKGKLKKENAVKNDKIDELAAICVYDCSQQMSRTMADTFNTAIGQGDNAYTVLQMAAYMAALGDGGVRKDASLVYDAMCGDEGFEDAGSIDGDHIKAVIEAMTAVTGEPGGGLYVMFQDFPYEVAAKTGTAQRAGKINTADEREYLRRHLHLIAPDISFGEVEDEAERLCETYPGIYSSEDKALRRAIMNLSDKNIDEEEIDRFKEDYENFAWTVALAPADDPQIAVAVMLVQGATSANAAPVVREIIGEYGEISRWEKLF